MKQLDNLVFGLVAIGIVCMVAPRFLFQEMAAKDNESLVQQIESLKSELADVKATTVTNRDDVADNRQKLEDYQKKMRFIETGRWRVFGDELLQENNPRKKTYSIDLTSINHGKYFHPDAEPIRELLIAHQSTLATRSLKKTGETRS